LHGRDGRAAGEHRGSIHPIRFFLHALLCIATSASAPRCLAQSATTQASSRLAIPSESQLTAARKLIHEVYPPEMSRQTAAERRALASKLYDAAVESKDDPAARYAMLQEAMNLAAGACDPEIIGKSADALEAAYAGGFAAMRAEALAKCYSIAPSPTLAGQVAAAQLAAADEAAANDNYDAAMRCVEKASGAARLTGDKAFISAVAAHMAEIREQQAQFLQLRPAYARLKTDPKDPASNLAVGQYLCFKKGKWNEGLAHLAIGSDPALKQLAVSEISASTEPKVRSDLAEQWWNLADQSPPPTNKAIKLHAAGLYRQALPGLGGLAKALALKRIELASPVETQAKAMPKPPVIASPPNAGPARELLADLIGGTRPQPGIVMVTQRTRVWTGETFKPPVAFHIIAQTDSTNIRIKYAASQIIFDWEANRSELRVDGGPANGRHKKGAGFIEPGTWAQIDLVVLPDTMIIAVNGQERYRTSADFSEIDQPFGLFTTGNAIVQVKSIQVRTP
jgi:hypothetical protein